MRIGRLLAGAAMLAMYAPAASAQESGGATATTPGSPASASSGSVPAGGADGAGEIVVTGFRASLNKATSLKRAAPIVEDVIAAEDIGKYPDANIAESLQRVTGVQINRSNGQGSTVNIRGLGPAFALTELNGREIVSGGGRTFDFLSLSPDFISSIAVEKSLTADQLEGGLTGIVNIKTPRPLDIGKDALALRAEGTYSPYSKKISPRASIVGNWVNRDRTFGVALGFGYDRREFVTYGRNSYGVERGIERQRNPPIDYNVDGDFNDVFAFDHALTYLVNRLDRTRYNAMGSVQWKPASNVELYLDGLYSKFNDTNFSEHYAVRWTNIAPATSGSPYGVRSSTISTAYNAQLLPAANGVAPQGFVSALDADGVDVRAEEAVVRPKTQLYSLATGTKIDLGRLHIAAEGSYSQGINEAPYYGFSPIGRASVALAFPDGIGNEPRLTFNRGFDPLNLNNYNFVSPYLVNNRQKDRIASGRIDLTYDVGDGFVRRLEAGFNYKFRRLVLVNSQATPSAQQYAQYSKGRLVYDPTVEASSGGSFNAAPVLSTECVKTGIPNFPACFPYMDFAKLYSIVDSKALFAANPFKVQPASGLNVSERTSAFYVQADFADPLDRLSGNIGVRYFSTKQVSSGFGTDLNNLVATGQSNILLPPGSAVAYKNDYAYFLPSLNLRYNVTEKLAVRFAASRAIARPSFAQLGTGLNVNNITLQISGSNPQLKPYVSDQVDGSIEYYFARGGLISLAGYFKSIDNYIIQGQTFPTLTLRNQNGGTSTYTFTRTAPLNLANAKFKGLELGIQLPLHVLHPAFEGLGLFFNGSYIDAPKVPVSAGNPPQRLAGVSKFSYNLDGYFEKDGFGAHFFYNWRGKSFNGGGAFGEGDFSLAYGQLDGSLSYDINSRLSVSIDFENLTNQAVRNINNFGLSNNMTFYGRRFTFGGRVRF